MSSSHEYHLPLDPARHLELIAALGDSPETVIAVHHLRRGSCRAYVAGDVAHFDGAIIQHFDTPTEPTGFGTDPDVLDILLQAMHNWDCISVLAVCAPDLGATLTRRMGVRVRYLDDIYYDLVQPASPVRNDWVQRLMLADLPLLEAAPPEIGTSGFGSLAALLTEGIVAGAVVEGRIVAIARTSARSERHGDIAVATLEAWRNYGFATAAASLVAHELQAAGQIPLWSAGAHNAASLRVAEKLGFTEVARRRYVIADSADRSIA
jgi:hypothetical protein